MYLHPISYPQIFDNNLHQLEGKELERVKAFARILCLAQLVIDRLESLFDDLVYNEGRNAEKRTVRSLSVPILTS